MRASRPSSWLIRVEINFPIHSTSQHCQVGIIFKIHAMAIIFSNVDGPTVFYRLTSLKLASEMVGAAYSSTHYPEIVLDNFTTVLGQRLGRQLGSLFPPVRIGLTLH